MGSGASTYSPPSSPYGSDLAENLATTGVLYARPNNLAPVIIKNCKEEYQFLTDFKEPIVYGCVGEGMLEHPLVKGHFFLLKDQECRSDRIQTMNTCRDSTGIFSTAQPTALGLELILSHLAEEGYSKIFLFNLREEPVLFVKTDKDFIPYSIRPHENIHDVVIVGRSAKQADLFEATVRKEVIDLATMMDENKFYFYNNLENLHHEPHVLPVQFEDHLLTSEEVYSRPSFLNSNLRYSRLCFSLFGAPPDCEVDRFINTFRPFLPLGSLSSAPAVLVTCDNGTGRSTLGMVMAYLFLNHKQLETVSARKTSYSEDVNTSNYELGQYHSILKFLRVVPNGQDIKYRVDIAIERCSRTCNLRTQILSTKLLLENTADTAVKNGEMVKVQLYKQCKELLERYYFLLCFQAYLQDQIPSLLSTSFSCWMQNQPEICRLRCMLSLPIYNTSYSLLSSRAHCLVSDAYIGLDLLSSQMDMRVSNFRKINTKSLAVYGMAQPSGDGISKVANQLLSKKFRHTHVVFVNLRNDVCVECDGSTYSLRDSSQKEEPVMFPGLSKTELEDMEDNLKKIIHKHKSFQVYQELSEPPVLLEFNRAFCISDLADNQKLQTLDMSYYRVPLLSDSAVQEKDFDHLMTVVCDHCKQDRLKDNSDTAFVFFCRTGKSRTTLAMAAAGLIFCHMKGFPYGAGVGEQERISCPNAQYTKGDFLIVQKLVRMLPDGQQTKREVDFILDEIFETMSPMHFHLREYIMVAYNKIKKAKSEEAAHRQKCLSMDYLERYIYLILFNAYLHFDSSINWKRPFSVWMKEVGVRVGVYELLDNLGFYDFDNPVRNLRRMTDRWKLRCPLVPFHGTFL